MEMAHFHIEQPRSAKVRRGSETAANSRAGTLQAMKKLTIALLLFSSPAWAAWNNIAETSNGTSYADPASIIRQADTATMWLLFDYKDFQRMVEVGYFSQKHQAEFDCKQTRYRVLTLLLHAEHMGLGKVIYADEAPHDWEDVEAGTLNETLRTLACR
jgi:hypothetical protein